MPTHPIGRGTVNVTINMPIALRQRLQEFADASQCSLSEYLRRLMADAADSGVVWEVAPPVKRFRPAGSTWVEPGSSPSA